MIKTTLFVLAMLLTQPVLANELKSSSSPYLAMHGDDPVAWLHLDRGNLNKAKEADKLIYISSGYFSCHWCHVMQRESYKNRAIARKLNKHFTPFKIDRELHPVVDAHLIRFIEQSRGYAGWPLNVFLTPEGYPVFAITYASPEEFDDILDRLNGFWEEDADRVRRIAESANQEINTLLIEENNPLKISGNDLKKILLKDIDTVASRMEGGFGNGSKFPSVPQVESLLRMGEEQEFLITTMDAMNLQHLQDHVHGGFFRYTTDPDWQTPHFEKMLYDNAQLARLFLLAGNKLDISDYQKTGMRTLQFMQKHMKDSKGGYIASLSAINSNDIEGGNYLWSEEQINELLEPRDAELIRAHWNMDRASRFDDGYLPESLYLAPRNQWLQLEHAYKILAHARVDAGDMPPIDDKRLGGWNGLVLSALAACVTTTQQDWCRDEGKAQAKFLISLIRDKQLVQGIDRNNQSLGPANLEDYALIIRGLVEWQEAIGDKRYEKQVAELTRQAWNKFHSQQGWLPSEQPLLPGLQALHHLPDTVMPSPSAIMLIVSATEQAGVTRTASANPYSHASLISSISVGTLKP